MKASLQTLIAHIDNDFNTINETAYSRGSIYYDVLIDDRHTDIVARRTTRVAYLIKTEHHETKSYTQLYIEDWWIAAMLSKLDKKSYEAVRGWMVKIYQGHATKIHSVGFSRTAMPVGIDEFHVQLKINVLTFDNISQLRPAVDTGFGFLISSQSFMDFLTLALSMESRDKLLTAITKHCILSDILRKNTNRVHSEFIQFKNIRSLSDLRNIYAQMNSQAEIEEYDKENFPPKLTHLYFEKLVSEV